MRPETIFRKKTSKQLVNDVSKMGEHDLVPGTNGPITEKPVVRKITQTVSSVEHNYGNNH